MCFATRSGNVKPVSHGIPDLEKPPTGEGNQPTNEQENKTINEPETNPAPPHEATSENVRVTGKTSQGPYSIQFEISDKNGRLCAGMYYTIKVASEDTVRSNLVTDANGMTIPITSDDPDDKVYLYIGHREEAYADLPTSREGEENIYDEYILNDNVDDQTVAPYGERKLAPITTQRLWQPWMPSEEIQDLIKNTIERFRPNFYDINDGGITIGYGHFTPHRDAARIRAQYPNGITREQASVLFEQDLVTRARYRALYDLIKVPMHQHEFDALVCMRFNNSGTTEGTVGRSVAAPHNRLTGQTSIKDHLNRGQYTQAGNRIPTIYNTIEGEWSRGVQNRRNCERDVFLRNLYQGW